MMEAAGPLEAALPGVGVLVVASVVHQLHHRLAEGKKQIQDQNLIALISKCTK